MKNLIVLFLFCASLLAAQEAVVKGKVTDAETKQPVVNANVIIENRAGSGTATGRNGEYTLEGINPNDKIVVSHLGYEAESIVVTNAMLQQAAEVNFELKPKIIPSQSVLIEASFGKEGVTPLAFDKIKRSDIEEDYTVQDIPEFLSTLPSTTFYSEGGNGIGYNYLSIRGFDQRRISVSINGIPQNDPEDHNVYWLDFPDLLASTEMIQVQRGAGAGVSGYPSIGGSINIITSTFSNKPMVKLETAYGSYTTKKFSAAYSSGLIDNKYSMYAKLSKIESGGYRDNSWADFNSYYLSAVRYDKKLTTQINFYGGPLADGLAYTGLPKFAVEDPILRKGNYSDWNLDNNMVSYSSRMQMKVTEDKQDTFYVIPRRTVEIENFSQPHYELMNEYKLNKDVTLNSALFLVIGDGFFDYDASWSILYDDYYRFAADGFDPNVVPTDALIRAKVENTQYGWIPRVSIKHNNGEFIAGGEFRIHRSNHWGRIQYANNLPPGYELDRLYYYYNGAKDIINGFVHESYNISDNLNAVAELQLAYHKYKLHNEKFVGTEFTVDNLFLNPRAGINYKYSSIGNIYLSYARVTREPRLKNYYDAAESSGGEIPQFEPITDAAGNITGFNFDNPLVTPETMNDFEFGTALNGENFNLSLNLFYMLFDNEIVKSGQVDRFGQPVTGNVDQTIHRGIELSGLYKFPFGFQIFANATFSKNVINKGETFVKYRLPDGTKAVGVIDLAQNRISGFPDFLSNFGLSYKNYGLFFQLTGRYAGAFYSDNYDENLTAYLNQFPRFVEYSDNKNEAYFTADFTGSYEFNIFNSLTKSKIYFQVNNIFDNLYSAYAIGGEFFPAAERHFLAGVQVGL